MQHLLNAFLSSFDALTLILFPYFIDSVLLLNILYGTFNKSTLSTLVDELYSTFK